jgi:hypothetical protein
VQSRSTHTWFKGQLSFSTHCGVTHRPLEQTSIPVQSESSAHVPSEMQRLWKQVWNIAQSPLLRQNPGSRQIPSKQL